MMSGATSSGMRYAFRRGMPVLELDSFATYNKEGEVLPPLMLGKVVSIRSFEHSTYKGIIKLDT